MPKQAKFVPVRKGTEQFPWQLNIPSSLSESGKRERRYFATKTEAQTFAELQKTRIDNFGSSSSGLTPGQRETAAAAFRLLGDAPATRLVEIVEQHIAQERQRTASVTVVELQTEFTKAKQKRSAKYLRQIRHAFAKLAAFADTKVSDINGATIEGALKDLAEANRNLHLRVLRAAFNFAVKKEWLSKNPVSSLEFTSERHGEVEILTITQAAELLTACVKVDPALLPYTAFGIFAGVRPEELVRMRWEHVKLDEKHIVLPMEVTKTSRRRVIEIEPTLAAWLEWFISNHGIQTGAVTPATNLRRRLRAIRKEAGLELWIQDVMRHTYASNWLAKYGDIDRLLLNLGHYSSKVLWEHYHRAVLRKDADSFWTLMPKTGSKIVSITAATSLPPRTPPVIGRSCQVPLKKK